MKKFAKTPVCDASDLASYVARDLYDVDERQLAHYLRQYEGIVVSAQILAAIIAN
jgi:hypothetical protein